jgi:hypothetical protein
MHEVYFRVSGFCGYPLRDISRDTTLPSIVLVYSILSHERMLPLWAMEAWDWSSRGSLDLLNQMLVWVLHIAADMRSVVITRLISCLEVLVIDAIESFDIFQCTHIFVYTCVLLFE